MNWVVTVLNAYASLPHLHDVVLCLQTLFVQKLREVEAAGDVASATASALGLQQKELLSWYFDKMVER